MSNTRIVVLTENGKKELDRRCGLTIFYLPTYSPRLNIAQIVWNQLKYYWLEPQDYQTADTLLLNVY